MTGTINNNSPPSLGSLFDGIGGFPLAAVMNGIVPLWASEIEPFPIDVTKTRFPDMLHVGDITQLRGADLPPVDILTGGSPCQDLSVAGKRAGLEGERSGLFMEQIRVVKELRDADRKRGRAAQHVRPRWMVWENVPGAFNSGTPPFEDFRIVLEEICRIADDTISIPGPPSGRWEYAGAILGTEFSVAWRVFDTQYWPGTPQRRRRIYLITDFGGHTAPQILFEQHRLFGDTTSGEGAGQGPAAAAGGSTEGTGRDTECLTPWDCQSKRIHDPSGVWPSLYSGGGGGHGYLAAAFACNQRDKVNCHEVAREGPLGGEVRDLHDVAAAVCASQQIKQQTLVAIPINTQVALRRQKEDDSTGFGVGYEGDPAFTLQAAHSHGVFTSAGFCAGAASTAGGIGYAQEVAPTLKASASGTNMVPSILCVNDQGGQRMDVSKDIAGTLRNQTHGHEPIILPHADAIDSYCIAGNIIDRQVHNGGNHLGVQTDISYTLSTTDRHAVFSRQRVDIFHPNDVASTQSARQHKDATDLVLDVAGMDCRNGCENGDISGTLQVGTSLNKIHPVRTGNLIRRLTPLECERLQGYPDFWTLIPGCSDTARYKALGNSVAIPCVDFVMRGIAYFYRQQHKLERGSPCSSTPKT